MRRPGWKWTIGGVVGASLLLMLIGCGGNASSDDTVQTVESALRHRRPPPPPPGTGGSTGSGGSSSGGSNADAIIRAAQTPDGQAIPQPAGPNGVCAPVVQLLGFWSCPTIGQTCSYASGGVTHHCTCSRTDGEGQSPSWICD
jgi:hypothetical protein